MKFIETLKSFLEKKHSHKNKFGCIMLELKVKDWSKITSKIDKKDIYDPDGTYGIEDNVHVTIIFGLHENIKDEDVEKIINNINFDDFKIETDGIGIFENQKYDVVKINIKSDYLNKLNEKFKKLPNTDEYGKYHPHITISYVKLGKGKKYTDPDAKFNIEIGHNIVYYKVSGEKIKFKI